MSDIEWKVLKSNDDAERAQLNKILADIRQQLYSSSSSGGVGTVGNTTVTGSFEDRLNAVANAWRDLSARVYRNGDEVTAIAQDIAYLSARIDDSETGQSGMAEAIDSLITRVTFNEQGIEAVASRTTDLEAAVNDPVSGLSGLGEAIDTLSTRVATNEDGIVSVGERTTSLENEVRDEETGLAATASAVDELTNTVGILGDDVFSISNRTTTLENEIHDPETGLQANASAIDNLGSSVQQLGDDVVAVSNRTTDLEVAVNDPETGLAATASATEDLRVEVDTLSNTVLAAYTLDLDANGYIVGWKFTNDGSTGVVDFRADRFRISAPGSIKSVEFADGILISDTGTHSYYHGVDFGALNDLITWFGATPTAGPDGATTNNGLFWIKNDGSGYFGGGLSNTVVENLPIVQEIIINIDDLDGEVVAVIQQVNNLETAINDPVTGLSTRASLSQLNEVKSRLDNTGGGLSIESVASTVNALNTAVNHPSTGLATKASNTRMSAAESRLNNTGGGLSIESVASNLSSLTSTVNNPTTGLATKASNTRVSTVESRLNDTGGGKSIESVASEVLTLRSDVNNSATKAELTSEQQARASADDALAKETSVVRATLRTDRHIIPNANFVDGLTGWTANGGWGHSNFEGRSWAIISAGSYEAGSNARLYTTELIAVSPGEKLRFSARVRRGGAGGFQASAAHLMLRLVRSGGTEELLAPSAVIAAAPNGAQTTVSYDFDVPLDVQSVQIGFRVSGVTNGDFRVSSVEVIRLFSAQGATILAQEATAQSLSQVVTDVSQQGDTLLVHGQRLDSLQGEVEGKADFTYVQSIEGDIADIGETASSALTKAEGLEVTVGGQSASINELREAVVEGAVVDLRNPGFEAREVGWGQNRNGTGGVPVDSLIANTSFSRSGLTSLRFNASASSRTLYNKGRTPARLGDQFRGGFWFATSGISGGVEVVLRISGYDSNGNYVSGSDQNTYANVTGTNGYAQLSNVYTVTNPQIAYLGIGVVCGAFTGTRVMVDDFTFERLGQDLVSALAKYSLAVQAGGDIAGIQLLAGGGISAFRILASMFQIVDPGGTGGYTHSAGVSVWRIGSAMIAIGPGFGAGNEFVFWAGPNQSNLNNCTRANAGMYFTRTNDAYFGGTLTAGALYHPSQATFTAYPLNVQAEVGPFVSQGGTKRVSSQFRYLNNGTVTGNVTAGHGQTFNGTVTIYRRIGSGSWTEVNSYPITGVKSAIYQSELNRTVVVTTINGAISYNDTSTSTSDFSYRARVTALSDPTVAGVPVEGEITIASKEG